MGSKCCDHWFAERLLRQIVKKHLTQVMMGRPVLREALYRELSWWYKFTRGDTRHVLRLLAGIFPGITFAKHGLLIPSSYLDRALAAPAKKETRGGESNGVGA